MPDLHRCSLARRGPRPPDWEACGPCRDREDHQWIVTAGLHQALVRASCATAAREAVAWRLHPRRLAVDLGPLLERVTARPASPEDVERFEQMVAEARVRQGTD